MHTKLQETRKYRVCREGFCSILVWRACEALRAWPRSRQSGYVRGVVDGVYVPSLVDGRIQRSKLSWTFPPGKPVFNIQYPVGRTRRTNVEGMCNERSSDPEWPFAVADISSINGGVLTA